MAFNLDALIAHGPGQMNFSPLSNLLGDYMAGRDMRIKYDMQNAFRDGVPMRGGQVDYDAMAQTAFANGDHARGVQFASLATQQRRWPQNGVGTGGVTSGSTSAAAPSAIPLPRPNPLRTAPPAVGSAPEALPQIPIVAVRYLQQNPDLSADFDAKYGDGLAAVILGRNAYD